MDVTRTKAKPATRAITIEDLMEFRIPNDPQISPDGSRVVCPVTAVDAPSNGYRTHLWIVPIDGRRGSSRRRRRATSAPAGLRTARAWRSSPTAAAASSCG